MSLGSDRRVRLIATLTGNQRESMIAERDALELLGTLVGVPSVNPRDRAMVASEDLVGEERLAIVIRDRLQSEGIDAEIQEVEPGRANVMATLGSPQGGPRLLIDGHLDTVAAEPLHQGSFKGELRGDRFYGVGAADDKGGLAAAILAIEAIHRERIRLTGNVILAGVIGEEGPPRGTELLVDSGLEVDGAIVVEPTSLGLCIGQKGGQFVEFTTHGRATHGSVPGSGVNAIDKMLALLGGLHQLPLLQEDAGWLGRTTMSTGLIQGGIRPNIVPDTCRAVVDVRLVPGHTLDRLAAELEVYLRACRDRDPLLEVEFRFPERGSEAAMTARSAAVVGSASRALLRATGTRPEIRIAPYWTDAEFLIRAGIPTVIFGPGSVEHCHRPREYVEIGQVVAAARVCFETVLDFCGYST